MRSDFVERLFEIVVVRCKRDLLFGVAREDDEAHAIAGHFVDGIFNLLFRPFEAVGGSVLGQHGAGNVKQEDDFNAFLRHFAPHFAPANIDERQDHEPQCTGDEQR